MQATARIRYLLMSPRKIRRVAELIRGKSVEQALAILKFTNKAAALPLAKTIQSATANALSAEGTSHLKAEDLSVARVIIDEGPRARRVRFRAMGRVYRYKKRLAHVTVVVEGEAHEIVARAHKAAAAKKVAAGAGAPESTEAKEAKGAHEKPAVKKTGAKKKTAKKPVTGKKKAAPKAGTKRAKSAKPAAAGKKAAAKPKKKAR
jgi:large subunit ribosomal protein L22